MKKALTKVAMFTMAFALTMGEISCESDYSKESNALIQRYEASLRGNNYNESKNLSNLLESRELNSKQTATVQMLNRNLSELELQIRKKEQEEAKKKCEEALRKADEAKVWLENSINEYAKLLRKQGNANTLDEYMEIEKQKVAMEKKRDEKLQERDRYLNEARIYQSKMNN